MQSLSKETSMNEKKYRINEIFYSLQGEGVRAGTPNFFVRFSGCNMACDQEAGPKSPGGFVCDTEFESGVWLDSAAILERLLMLSTLCKAIIWTGGEPGLQLDAPLIATMKAAGYYQAIESNGSLALPDGLDWVCISPKVAEHGLKVEAASEVKYVRHAGQGIPQPRIKADHYLISPAFDHSGNVPRETLAHCIELCKANPPWRLSLQQHKVWKVR
jgi:organic radical activating enzyme